MDNKPCHIVLWQLSKLSWHRMNLVCLPWIWCSSQTVTKDYLWKLCMVLRRPSHDAFILQSDIFAIEWLFWPSAHTLQSDWHQISIDWLCLLTIWGRPWFLLHFNHVFWLASDFRTAVLHVGELTVHDQFVMLRWSQCVLGYVRKLLLCKRYVGISSEELRLGCSVELFCQLLSRIWIEW